MPLLSRTLRLKVSIGVCLVLVLLLAPMNWIQYELQRRASMRELELLAAVTGTLVVHSLEEAMLHNNRAAIQSIVDGAAQAPGVQSIYLINLAREVAASPGREHNGERLDQNDQSCIVCHRMPVKQRPRGVVVVDTNNQASFRTMTPIPNSSRCYRCHSPENRLNGVFYMDFSMTGLQTRLQQGLRTAFIGSVLIIAVSALVLYFLLSWLFITPMERIALGIQRFSQGNRSARVPIQTQDEVGILANVFNEMADTIQVQETTASQLYQEIQAKEAIRRQLLDRLTTAREDEHKRLARRIHDEVGQLLTGLSLHLKLCEQAIPNTLTVAHTHLGKAVALVQRTMDQTHILIGLLRPTVLDDYGLVPAVREEVAQRLLPLGLQVHLETDGDLESLSAEMATVAFRVVQEAVTNVIRHAYASHIWLQMQLSEVGFSIMIEDDGVGLPSERDMHGWGILGMQERAAAVGGKVEVSRRYPTGTRVQLWLPGKESDT